ncbi:MAG TPA: RIP metalloprotease RseP [Gemmatimonadaceae bacterium]|nr:RIP metalloprotease RseP [Gemmatimonadaceae bacterium]
MLAWLAPIFVFGLVVFIHELGHFLAAKSFGVYAPRFSIGFGPALLKWRVGETEYKLAALPLGGYVRMASRQDEESAFLEGGAEESAELPDDYDPEAMTPFGPKPVPENRWFESKPLYARLTIMVAGVTMNLLLGFGINAGLAKAYNHNPTTKVSDVVAGHPAAAAGILAGDGVVALNGQPVTEWAPLLDIIGKSAGVPVRLGVLRQGQREDFTVVPVADSIMNPLTGKNVVSGKVGMIASLDPNRISFVEAIRQGGDVTWEMATLVFTALQRIATRPSSVSELGGPIAVAQSSVQAARQGIADLFYLIALLSVNLAVFNLLPIPILDGGQIVVQVVEAGMGRPLTERAREYVMRLGLAFILLLFLTVTYNDLRRVLISMLGGGKS